MKYLLLISFVILAACSATEEWNAENAVEKIFSPDELQFRKFEIGMTKPDFDASYTGDAIFGNEMEVIDSLMIDNGIYCETAFRFSYGRLTEIVVTVFLEDEDQKDELFVALREKLNNDLGKGMKDNDQYYWRGEGGMLTTDIFLRDLTAPAINNKSVKYVISLYYTAGTAVS